MTEPIDFSACERLPGRAYNGANGKKIAVRYDGAVWLVKFPPSAADRPTALSYTNSCLSEHLASTIANMIGLKSQETRLGTFTNGKAKTVCACRDFTADGKQLYDFCSIKNTVIDSETNGTGTELDDVLETIELQSFVDPVELKSHFWDMFVVDAFLGNFDRHNGNWGFLVDPVTRKAEIAPAYDFGSCLLPQADDDIMRRVIDDKAERDARIYNFPASALKQNGKKIGYVDFIAANRSGVLAVSLARIVPSIDLTAINAFIDDTPLLTDLQQQFYKTYLAARYEALFV
ncbi:MAG: HipA domain-containing protein [Kiritimatiellae bacterium]|nr:HipA domain-containing protein [Kiritimatiellia bacterium]